MTRYNDVLILQATRVVVDEEGNRITQKTPRTVFCNRYKLSATNRLAARQAGLKADIELQVRSCDYDGETLATYDGKPYTVEDVSDQGEFTRLTLGKRSGNGM